MGMESFYINITMNGIVTKAKSLDLLLEIKENEVLESTIEFSLISFFEGCQIIYEFIISNQNFLISLESNQIPLKDNLNSFLDFFNKMYEIWIDKLNDFNNRYGKILINSGEDFYKKYKRIKKKIIKLNS